MPPSQRIGSRIYEPPEYSFLLRCFCLLRGHRWVDHRGHRVQANWYCGQHVLWCDRCGGVYE